MRRIQLDEGIRPLSEFRSHVTSFIDKVRETKRPLVITQRGKSAAIILDAAEYESLLNQLDLLRDVRLGETQIKERLGVSHEAAAKQVLESISPSSERGSQLLTGFIGVGSARLYR